MTVRVATLQTKQDQNTTVHIWSGLLNGDTGDGKYTTNAKTLMAQLTSGTIGAGGTVIWQGSIDGGTNWFPLNDQAGVAISMTALLATKMILERPLLVRPNVTAGDGTTSLVAMLVIQN